MISLVARRSTNVTIRRAAAVRPPPWPHRGESDHYHRLLHDCRPVLSVPAAARHPGAVHTVRLRRTRVPGGSYRQRSAVARRGVPLDGLSVPGPLVRHTTQVRRLAHHGPARDHGRSLSDVHLRPLTGQHVRPDRRPQLDQPRRHAQGAGSPRLGRLPHLHVRPPRQDGRRRGRAGAGAAGRD